MGSSASASPPSKLGQFACSCSSKRAWARGMSSSQVKVLRRLLYFRPTRSICRASHSRPLMQTWMRKANSRSRRAQVLVGVGVACGSEFAKLSPQLGELAAEEARAAEAGEPDRV